MAYAKISGGCVRRSFSLRQATPQLLHNVFLEQPYNLAVQLFRPRKVLENRVRDDREILLPQYRFFANYALTPLTEWTAIRRQVEWRPRHQRQRLKTARRCFSRPIDRW